MRHKVFWHDEPEVGSDPDLISGAQPVVPQPNRSRSARPTLGLVLRIAALLSLTLLAYGGVFYDTAHAINGGSRAAYLLVVPVLLVMIAYGRRTTSRGVGDTETDWVLAISLGGLALLLSYLAGDRFPTLSGMWNLQLLGAVMWVAFAAIILFGVRRVGQLWPLWLFASVTVTPFPSLLLTAELGGTTAAASAVAAIIGAIAVFLAGRRSALRWRLAATAGCALAGVGAAVAIPAHSLPLSVAISAGVVPLLSFALLQRFTATATRRSPFGAQPEREPAPLPHRSPLALMALAAVAAAHLVLTTTASASIPEAPLAFADAAWTSRAGLSAPEDFGFINRYLGPDATLTRYLVPSEQGYPTAAVDVITAGSLEALRTTRYTVWYPAAVIPDYRIINIGAAIPDALVLATDSSTNTDGNADDWYAVSWLWAVGHTYQQVFVVVSQNATPQGPAPPRPAPPSLRLTVVAPLLWITRQQADPATLVDTAVSDRAQHVVNDILKSSQAPK